MATGQSSAARSWTSKQLAWATLGGMVVGAGLLYGAGFHWLGTWETGEQVQSRLAVADCVQSFLLQTDRGPLFAELQSNTSSYKRRQLIRSNKWAPSTDVADLCDSRIRALDPAHFTQPAPEAAPEAAIEGKTPA